MKILFLASEIAPFARTGGLADVSGALPLALAALGHDVRLAMPCYGDLRRRSAAVDTGVRLPLAVAGAKQPAAILETTLQGLPVYLVEQPALFDRAGLYGTPAGDYPDNPQRFAAFCQAALAMLPALGFRPEVLHGNDWQTGLTPVLLRAVRRTDPFFAGCGALFTIHNLGYQGLFPATALPQLGLDPALARPDALEFWGQLSLLKGGVVFADRVNTVSPTYRRETLGPEQGHGFDGILRARGEDYSGILNGIDRQQWNPAADAALVQPYDVFALAGKATCKTALQRELGLDERPDVPLVALVTRIDPQKGLDLLQGAWGEVLRRDLQLVLLGSGEKRHTAFFAKAGTQHPGRVAVRLTFDDALSRRIFAAADLFLMPSRYEPCGLGQLIALRYGAVPVVRATGGLADTIVDPQQDPQAANGFSFADYSPWAMLHALDRALETWSDRPAWQLLQQRGMAQDFSWERSAQRYLELYQQCREDQHD